LYLLTKKQKALVELDDINILLVSFSFFTDCTLTNEELANQIQNYLETKEVSFLQLEKENGLEGLAKKTTSNITIVFNEDPQNWTPISADNPYSLAINISNLNAHQVQIAIQTTVLYYDSWSLLKCAEQLQNIVFGVSKSKEEQISYLQYLGWKENLLLDPVDEAIKYWKRVSRSLEEQAYNWVIPTPNSEARTSYGKQNSFQKNLLSTSETSESSVKDIVRYLWVNLISSYTNTEDIILFERISSRVFEQLEDTFGAMDEFVPVSMSITQEKEIKEVVLQLKKNSETAAKYINYFNSEINQNKSIRSAAFDYGSTSIDKVSECKLERIFESAITLQVLEQNGNIKWRIVYDEASFNKDWIQEIEASFTRSIENFSNEKIKSHIELISLEDVQRITPQKPLNHFWNLFSSHVKDRPESIAIQTSKEEISYQKLDELINRLSSVLYEKGINQHKKVVVDVHRSLETVVLIFAILRNKATFIPVDFEQGESRIEMIITDVEPDLIISHSKNVIAGYNCTVVSSLFNATPNKELLKFEFQDHIAYILYTSGSTGTPKGCPIKMSSLTNYLQWSSENYFETSNNGHFSWFTPLTFDLTITSVFLPFVRGNSLSIIKNTLDTTESLRKYLTKNTHCDSIKLTPAHIILVDNLDIKASQFETVIIGGDILRPKHVQILKERFIGAKYYNEYGPTEATIGCVVKEITSPDSISVGTAIRNMISEVMNDSGNRLPPGIIGEVYLNGIGLTDGYLNREDLNEKVFSKDIGGNRWYKTGDLGYKTLSDDLKIIGRKDSQIKIRGYRIELDEITSFIEQNEEVTTCELITIGEEDNISMIACVESENDSILATLIEKVVLHFPEYMVPSDFIVLDRIPINKHGKTDRKRLRKQYKELKGKTFNVPENEEETIILELWKSIFNSNRISVTSDFFKEGGHSLNATKLVSLIRKTYQVAFTLKDIYKATSVREQAILINEKRISKTLEKAPYSEYYELTPTQKIFWVSEQKSEDSVQYTMPVAYRFQGILDVEALKKAFQFVITKHPIFSVVVVVKEGQPLATHIHLELPWIFRKINTDEELQVAVVHNNLATFNVTEGPLFRIELLQKASEEYYLLVNFHHLIFDGWSEKVFFDDLQYSYNFYEKGQEAKQVSLEWHPKDFSHWIHKKRATEEYKKQLIFWKEELANHSSNTSFPPFPNSEVSASNEGTSKSFKIDDKRILEKLTIISKELGVTPFSMWLRLFKVLLYKYTGEQKWIVGIPFANRAIHELRDQIGCYLNMLPVPSLIQENNSWKEQIEEEHQNLKKVIANIDCSYHDILDIYSTLQPNGKPLYDVMLTWLEDEIESNTLNGLEVKKLNNEKIQSKLGLVMSVRKKKQEIIVEYDFKNDLFTENFISEFHQNLIQTLANCLENINHDISTLQFVTEENAKRKEDSEIIKNTFVKEWAKSVSQYSNQLCVIDNQKYTYKEIDVLSNQYANTISKAPAVKENSIVAVEGFFGGNLIAAILGILKAGMIYLPIDVSWPLDRKRYVLEQSECSYLITNKVWEFPKQVSRIDESDVISAEKTYDLIREIHSNQWAYVLFTSGSTGKPKGVQIQHQAFMNMIKAQIEVFNMNTFDVVMPMASVAFDASLSEYFMALFSGGTLCFPTEEDKKTPKLLKQRIEDYGVTTITLTPSTLKVFKGSIVSIQKLICAGESLFAEDLKELPKELKIFNAYGPTECAVCASMYELDRTETNAISIGKAVANLKLKVMLPNRTEAPTGIKGILCVGGWPISSSYLNNIEANEEKYFTIEENGVLTRYYDTGDLVVKDENKNLIYLGRLDHQVQISGRRVELNEIKMQLLSLIEVEDVIVHYSKKHGHFLIAWIIASSNVTAETIRKELEIRLPEYMIPTDIILLGEIPLNSSGKTDIQKLLSSFHRKKNEITDKKNCKHKEMISVWRDALSTENIYDSTDFFKAGGNSLKAIQLIAKTQEQFGISLTIKSIYEHPILEDFTNSLLKRNSIHKEKTLSKEFYIASPAQKRFWILNSMNENSRMLQMHITFLLTGSLEENIFVSSINKVLARHKVYKSKFDFKDGELFVGFNGPQPTCVSVSNSVTKEAEELYVELLDHNFDLEQGELIKLMFEKTTSGDYFLGININHILADNWSIHLLLVEIFEAYRSKLSNALTDEKQVAQYDSFIEDFELYQNSENYKLADKYWSGLMLKINENGMQSVEAISDKVSNKNKIRKLWNVSDFSTVYFTKLGYSSYQYWVTLITLTNYALSGQNKLAMISPVAARTSGKHAQTHGLFMNMNPVLSQLSDEVFLSDFLERSKQDLMASKTFEEYPYTEMLKRKSILENKPLTEFIQVELQVNEIDDLNTNISLPNDITIKSFAEGNDFLSRKYALELHFNKIGNQWEFYCLWDTQKYSGNKIKEFFEALLLMANCLKEAEKLTVGEVVIKFKEKQSEETSKQQKEQKIKLASSFKSTKI
jgi:amino acid adenylation domain-containing protein